MNLEFDEATHTYTLDGKVIPSVTQILSIANDFSFVNKDVLERASKFGTAVHKATELYDDGILKEHALDTALVPYLNGWKKFLSDTKFEILESETRVYSKHGYAGTFDRLGLLANKLTLLDIKTSTTVVRSTALQLAAYKTACEEMHQKQIQQLIAVQLTPDNYNIKIYDDPTDFLTFRNFLSVYKWSHKND